MEQSADTLAEIAACWREQPPSLTQPTEPFWWDANELSLPEPIFEEGEPYYHAESGRWRVAEGECLNPSPEVETLLGPLAFEALLGFEATFTSVPDSVRWPDWKRARWGRTAVAAPWKDETIYLTPPEAVLGNVHSYPREIRKQADHDVAALMAATMLVARGPDELRAAFPSLPAYHGLTLNIPDSNVSLQRGRGRSLEADEVRAVWPSWTLAWRALEALDADEDPGTPLSRYQVMPWCGMGQHKAVLFVNWLEAMGYVWAEKTTTMFGDEGKVYRLVPADAE